MENIGTNEVSDEVRDEVKAPNDSSSDTNPKEDKPDIDIAVEALNLLNHGKRHLLLEDYSSAVASLQESCQLFDQRFGIGSEECGEAYLYYGTALLELARREDGLFDGVVHTKLAELSETEDEEEVDEEDDSQEDSQDETESKDQKPEDKKTDTEEDIEVSDEEKKKNSNESKAEIPVVAQTSSANISDSMTDTPECLPSTSKSEPNDDNNSDDEASNIEVSWEVLSLAKMVFQRHVDKNDNKLKLAETLQKLGEISIEWENNSNAIEILNQCLTARKEILSEDDRLIAETYLHLGIAYSFNNNIESANNCFQSALEVIETRISNQRQMLSTISAEDLDSITLINREIAKLENLLPDLRSKIEDSKDQMFNAKEALERERNERIEEEAIAQKNKEIKDKPISNISHLIKRKRQNSGSEESSKKVCSNGHNVVDSEKRCDETAATT